ncbi:hypothetical protein [Synechocystis sp. CACIAM 05]|uniref:hypothetical protein n=1 Tax=Synechocystis sp. CACIAM 05 TaxID=1933929 RepID=UPI00138E8125|nr:hypothetical protein [Synechocystis sp. CACIAM 05]QHU99587.1 hypothetical protein BWK47_05210 [Synechocystis sp. CACIAM 05]
MKDDSKSTSKQTKDLETIRRELDLNVRSFCEAIDLHHSTYYEGKKTGVNRLTLDQWSKLTELWLKSGKPIEQLIGCAWQDSHQTSDPRQLERVAV